MPIYQTFKTPLLLFIYILPLLLSLNQIFYVTINKLILVWPCQLHSFIFFFILLRLFFIVLRPRV